MVSGTASVSPTAARQDAARQGGKPLRKDVGIPHLSNFLRRRNDCGTTTDRNLYRVGSEISRRQQWQVRKRLQGT
jgi:hypothetical protein